MQEVRGKFENSVRYLYEGYEYHIDTGSPHLFRCSTRQTRRCRAVAEVIGQRPNQRVEVYNRHDCHPPNPTIFEETTMRQQMIDRSLETLEPPKAIFDLICSRFIDLLNE